MKLASEVQEMIPRVMARLGLSRGAAISYMLMVATGRLTALWRYSDTLPEGKTSKGVLVAKRGRKRAPRSKEIPRVSV